MIQALVVYTGFTLPLPNTRPYFRYWLPHINPVFYTFEGILANQFHNLELTCESYQYVPSGQGYEEFSQYGTCTLPGSQPGEATVLGDDYLSFNYNYSWSHVWRNVGIIIGFYFAFIAVSVAPT